MEHGHICAQNVVVVMLQRFVHTAMSLCSETFVLAVNLSKKRVNR